MSWLRAVIPSIAIRVQVSIGSTINCLLGIVAGVVSAGCTLDFDSNFLTAAYDQGVLSLEEVGSLFQALILLTKRSPARPADVLQKFAHQLARFFICCNKKPRARLISLLEGQFVVVRLLHMIDCLIECLLGYGG